jgi:hypothetical protein
MKSLTSYNGSSMTIARVNACRLLKKRSWSRCASRISQPPASVRDSATW